MRRMITMRPGGRVSVGPLLVSILVLGVVTVSGCGGSDGSSALVIEVFDRDDPATLILTITDDDIEAFDMVADAVRPPHGLIKLRDPDQLISAQGAWRERPPLNSFRVRVTVDGTQVSGSVIPVGSPAPVLGVGLTLGALVGGRLPWEGEFLKDSLSLQSFGTSIDGVDLVEAAHAAWQRAQGAQAP